MCENVLAKSINLLNSLLIFVVAAFMIEAVFARSMDLNQIFVALMFAVPIKFYCYAGIYGYLAEIISGRELLINYSCFHHNALRYFLMYAFMSCGLCLLTFLLYILFPSLRIMTGFKYF